MKTVDMLNKIKWDKSGEPEKTFVFYRDRISNELVKISLTSIKNVWKNFITVEKGGGEIEIPIHRIEEIRKNGRCIFRKGVT